MNYVQGIDAQKLDFERGIPSYLQEEWSEHGWWYFYLYGLAIKVPLGTWLLALTATVLTFLRRYRVAAWADELFLIAPLISLLIFISSQSGFSIHFRYVLPIFSFLFIWSSKSALLFIVPSAQPEASPVRSVQQNFGRVVVMVALIWSIASSICCYPNSLAYFNEIVGGSKYGHKYLLDSSLAWGQDLIYLKDWYDAHPHARPFFLASSGNNVDPRTVGIEFTPPPLGTSVIRPTTQATVPDQPLPPGWYAIDANYLQGSRRPVPDGQGGLGYASKDGKDYSYFQQYEPVERVGASFFIYCVQK